MEGTWLVALEERHCQEREHKKVSKRKYWGQGMGRGYGDLRPERPGLGSKV